jgi:uncharacterized membrane protein YdbT with pleckstrin-like domain
MDPAPGETILFEGHPSWRSILGFYIKGLGLALVAGAIGWFALSHGAGAGIFAGAFAIVVVVGLLKRIATTYVIVARRTQETRLDRVQNVNTAQSVLERLLQVGTVNFDTAGTEDSDFAFVGVADPGDVVKAVDRAQREAAAAPGL